MICQFILVSVNNFELINQVRVSCTRPSRTLERQMFCWVIQSAMDPPCTSLRQPFSLNTQFQWRQLIRCDAVNRTLLHISIKIIICVSNSKTRSLTMAFFYCRLVSPESSPPKGFTGMVPVLLLPIKMHVYGDAIKKSVIGFVSGRCRFIIK